MDKEKKTVNWNDVKRKIWIKQTWERTKDTVKSAGRKTVNFIVEHPLAASMASYVIAEGFKTTRKAMQNRKEHNERFRTFYDYRTRTWTETKRDLKPWEVDELEERYRNGESKHAILKEFNVLK